MWKVRPVIERLLTQAWIGQAMFVLLGGVTVFFGLLPLNFVPGLLQMPDILTLLAMTIVLRRPEFVPFWLLGVTFFLADLMLQRPPGLWTAIMVLTAEFLRTQEYRLREAPFPLEWVLIAVTLVLATFANRAVMAIAMMPLPGFGAVMRHVVVNVAAYPLVVLVCYLVFRIRKIRPDEAIRLGHRL
jgi:rod shape-determining protein MreD